MSEWDTPSKQARNRNAIEAAILNRVLDRDRALNCEGPLSRFLPCSSLQLHLQSHLRQSVATTKCACEGAPIHRSGPQSHSSHIPRHVRSVVLRDCQLGGLERGMAPSQRATGDFCWGQKGLPTYLFFFQTNYFRQLQVFCHFCVWERETLGELMLNYLEKLPYLNLLRLHQAML